MLSLVIPASAAGLAVVSLGLPPLPWEGCGPTLLYGQKIEPRRSAIRVSRTEFDPHELAGMRRLWLAVINQAVMDGDTDWFENGSFRQVCELAGFEPAWVAARAHTKLQKYVGVVAARRARALAHKART